jgi:hypothetical protein
MRADGKSILCPLLLLAGPAVSFVGSPTISPTTVVACVGFLLLSGSPAHQTQQQSSHGTTPEQDPSIDLPQRSLRSRIGAEASAYFSLLPVFQPGRLSLRSLCGAVAANNKHPGFSDPRRMFFFELPRDLFHHQWARVVCPNPTSSIYLSRSDAPIALDLFTIPL